MQFTKVATLLGFALAAQAMPAVVVVTETATANAVPAVPTPAVAVVYQTVYVTAGSDNNAAVKPSTSKVAAVAPTAAAATSQNLANGFGHKAAPVSIPSTSAAAPASTPTDSSSSSSSSSSSGDWIMTMLCRINAVRAQHGVQPLGLTCSGASDMTHSDPKGSLGKRLSAAGTSWSGAAENIAAGMDSPATAQTALENSPSHLANMISANMAYFGAGALNGYYTQNFYALPGNARPANVPTCN
ncbi:hypothetical protein DL89DRAFT_264966 [Linderina pennispora]|uniref:SCP domain-containing protein n=1 Tax=Linderina pennispora TaxID=61395 RepID=A0A1Y1WH17_9FUNG|nr:uncharacterized protein DL89DRAFT_264966 [Linderina pennispora]ORX72762.1 hypothetical protein DL89DRAFT_264966 [Linderina pennispora]